MTSYIVRGVYEVESFEILEWEPSKVYTYFYSVAMGVTFSTSESRSQTEGVLIWYESNSLRHLSKHVLGVLSVAFLKLIVQIFTFILGIMINPALMCLKDSMGEMEVGVKALWGRVLENIDVWKWCGRVLLMVGVLDLVTHFINKNLQDVL